MILLRKARIYDIRSKHHNKVMDILIERGVITKIAKSIVAPKRVKIIESKSLSVSPGWLDIGAYNGEPGYEYREDLTSLMDAAAQGGYVHIAPFPTGQPSVDSKGQLHFLISSGKDHIVNLYPIAAATKNREGHELSELLDLNKAGAIAFSDGDQDHINQDQLIRIMQYLKSIKGITIYNAAKESTGHVHEGSVSVSMGIEGIPAHNEVSNVEKALRCSEYAESKLVLHNISNKASINAIKRSSNKKNISISVPFMNLIQEDTDVLDFNLNLKVSPPLRDKSDKVALCKAIQSGSIDVITSNHTPLSIEEKDQPFGLSQSGASTIETVFAALNTFNQEIDLDKIIHCLSVGPHRVLGLPCQEICVGSKAELTVFDPKEKVTFNESQLKSKSKNNPYLNLELKGKVIGIINGSTSNL